MLSNLNGHWVAFGLAAVALALPASPSTLRAADENLATVAILLPVGTTSDLYNCREDAVAIVFNQNNENDSSYTLALESGAFGDFSGVGLRPVTAKYITRGFVYKTAVYGLGSDLPPARGAMLFDPNSDVTIEYCGYAVLNGPTLEEEFNPQFASHFLVIVTGTVH